ncbi:MAG: hypothetical protein IKW04_01650 [Clostridia bacterium]|nr:hypothetical protein [Clostridia bacterium]
MSEWISNLKQVVLIVLVCEFLKELLSTDSFRKYVQFSIRLFLFLFLLSSLFGIKFALPEFTFTEYETEEENLLLQEYETQIATQITEELSRNNLSVSQVTVQLNDQYEILCVTVFTKEESAKIQAVLKGDFPYEVVYPTEEFLDEMS